MAYAQSDPRWASQLLGFNTGLKYNLGNFGCAVTMVANGLTVNGDDTTPAVVNNQLKLNGGFAAIKQLDGSISTKGSGIMIWSAVPQLNPAIVYTGTSSLVGEINNWLAADKANYAFIEVKNKADGQHFVLGTQLNTIIDSADGYTKNILTYPIVLAHLWRWASPGKGSATPVPTTPITKGDTIMTDAEEQEAYQIVLGRTRDGAYTGRSGIQFIEDAKAELAERAAQAAATLADLQAKLGTATEAAATANQTASDAINAKVTAELALQKATTAAAVPPTVYIDSYANTEVPHTITRVAKVDGEMVDFGANIVTGSTLPTLPFKAGTVFHQYSTFTVAGVSYVRTQQSRDNKQWYGTLESLFDPIVLPKPDMSGADAVSLNLSKVFGSIGKWVYSLVKHK